MLSLFQRNPGLIGRVAAVLGAAPSLAEHLASHPAALDGLLSPEEDAPDPARLLRARLKDARRLEEVIEITRRTVREEDFSISVGTMEGRLDADEAGLRRTALADAALAALLGPVLADFATRYGRVRGGAMAVVAMGKAGGREMMAGSDLDLMLVYDHPEEVTESTGGRTAAGARSISSAPAHAYVAAVTAPGADGQLYAVDMRLRPSGNKGPVAVSLGGVPPLPCGGRVDVGAHGADPCPGDRRAGGVARAGRGGDRRGAPGAGAAERMRADAAAMRARLARDLPPDGPWDVKLRAGGQIEVEFIAQVLQLVHARGWPGVCGPTTRMALRRLAAAGRLGRRMRRC